MMTGTNKRENGFIYGSHTLMWVIAIFAMLFVVACGGGHAPTNTSPQYPTGIGNDIEKQLKYDARVQDFQPDGNTLVVNVNDSWMSSPPGMRQRALGQWYSLWQASHGNNSKIVVKHQGTEVDIWTAEKGYQPADMEKKKTSES
ncbi:MAG: hypothetical protein WBV94_32720 [Blastocatellia bacterium]